MAQVDEGIYYPASMSTPQSTNAAHTPAADLPGSQEPILSAASTTLHAPTSTTTTTTTTTTTETHLPAPTRTNAAAATSLHHNSSEQASRGTAPAAANAPRTGDTAAAPMSLASPAAQGSKRTADGSLKGEERAVQETAPRTWAHAHKRNKSMDTHRIGELSAQLKTRLSYAMVKVQNGWEKQSLDELEEVHSQRGSPNSAPGRSDRLALDFPAAFDCQRRPSGVSDTSDPIVIMSPASDPSGAHAASSSLYWRPTTKNTLDAAASLMSVTASAHGRGLAPAPEIQASRRRRSSASHPPPSMIGIGQRKHFSDLGTSQRTPPAPRAGILRMPSQQAERDAVDTLICMGSPNTSQRLPHNTPTAPSPLRADAPQRRVMFDAYPPQEKHIVYHAQMPPPPPHQYAPYTAHPAR